MSTNTKNCIYCATPIADSALVCPNCKNYQSRWRNNVIFIAGLTGGAALIASAITFIVDRSATSYKEIFWKDQLNVLAFRSDFGRSSESVVSNTGYGDVYLLEIEMYWRGSTEFPINMTLKKNDLITIKYPADHNDSSAENSDLPRSIVIEGNRSGIPSAAMIKDLKRWAEAKQSPQCFWPLARDPGDAGLNRVRNNYANDGHRVITEDAEGILRFSSLHDQTKQKKSFPLTVMFARSDRKECQAISSENN